MSQGEGASQQHHEGEEPMTKAQRQRQRQRKQGCIAPEATRQVQTLTERMVTRKGGLRTAEHALACRTTR